MEITSRKNPAIQRLRLLTRDKKARAEAGEFVIEGYKLCSEAVASGLEITEAYATRAALQKYSDAAKALEGICTVTVISDEISEYISDTRSPQGIFAVAKSLDKIFDSVKIKEYRKIVVLDNLQDTGNVGTIIRTADALGIDAVIVSKDTADIYSPKVVRGAMGSLFRLPCFVCELAQALGLLKDEGFDIYAAILDPTAQQLQDIKFNEKSAAVIGNEGNGISENTLAYCNKKLYIPISNAESLNAGVAASIICWEMAK